MPLRIPFSSCSILFTHLSGLQCPQPITMLCNLLHVMSSASLALGTVGHPGLPAQLAAAGVCSRCPCLASIVLWRVWHLERSGKRPVFECWWLPACSGVLHTKGRQADAHGGGWGPAAAATSSHGPLPAECALLATPQAAQRTRSRRPGQLQHSGLLRQASSRWYCRHLASWCSCLLRQRSRMAA